MKRLWNNATGSLRRQRSWYAKAVLNSNPHMTMMVLGSITDKRVREDLLEEGAHEMGLKEGRVLVRRNSSG